MSTLVDTLAYTQAQTEVWMDQRAWPQSSHLWVGGSAKLIGPLDLPKLRQALQQLSDEQLALRLVPQPDHEQQVLLAQRPVELRELPLPAGLSLDEALQAHWTALTQTPATLGQEPPWAMHLIRPAPEGPQALEHGLLLVAHHLVLDGWATAQFMRRWAELYTALVLDQPATPSDGEAYREAIEASLSYRGSKAQAEDTAFWRQQWPEAPPALLPRRQSPNEHLLKAQLPAALLHAARLPRERYVAWGQAARTAGQTEFALLAAALALYYARVQGLSEICLGVPTLNRSGRSHRQALGMYAGVLPLRIAVDPEQSGQALMAHVGAQLRAAMRHARFPLSDLARELQLMRAGRDSPFDLLLSFERQDYALSFGLARLVETRQMFAGRARFPLSLTLCEFGPERDIELVFEGSSACLEQRELDLLARRLLSLMQHLAERPERPVGQLPLLDEAEREALIEGTHRDLARLDAAPSFVERVLDQATLHPESLALIWDGGALRYGELAAQALALAGRLMARGVQPGSRVALALPRGAALGVALLAVARCRAAFLPLDVEHPDTHLCQIVQESGAVLILGLAEQTARWQALNLPHLGLSPDLNSSAMAPLIELPPLPTESDLAYVLYTSGSSGRPKGVAMSHGALARRLAWLSRVWDISPGDRSLQGTQPCFDPALIEWLLPLVNGGSVALPPPGRQAPETWGPFAARHGCSFSALVPTTLQRLLDGIEALSETERARLRLRVACCGGEVLSPNLAARWHRLTRAQLWNVYGPTEACIFATAWACRPEDQGVLSVLPIGVPVDDTRVYVLDAQGQPLPYGAVGELWIGGATLAQGYLNRPDLDAKAFAPDPFVEGGRIYRSGDRAWWDGEGRLQFAGRGDRQIKLRGYRIELAEVEAAILQLPGVREACVQVAELHGRRALQAWVSPRELDPHHLQGLLRERLPDYMLPAHWQPMVALPLLPGSLKVDLKDLPKAQLEHLPARAPASRLEAELLQLMREVLQDPELGVDDDFFDEGGDSLAALDLLLGVEKRLGQRPTLQMLARAPTAAALAHALAQPEPDARSPLNAPRVALTLSLAEDSLTPTLFLAASGHGDLLRFQGLAQALLPHLQVQMLQPPAHQTMQELADAYAHHIAAQVGGRPVLLAGFSVGGVTALETARRLQALGQTVQALVLIDSVFPRWLFRQGWLWKLLGGLTKLLRIQELTMNGRRLGAMFNDPGLVGQVLALRDYRVAPYSGAVTLIRTSGLGRWQRGLFGPWQRRLTGNKHGSLTELEVQGLHGSIFEASRVGGLAQCLLRACRALPAPPS
ncbi:amino acid adenylation domain-containing protein [Inhella inkyongensis]|uniref:Amino acid adenylation domain-containing protein n=1 Tax=Inhella inkyongensis TaxID=392593 RepID=A0A840RZ57_9BURK|nr:non-ribosomal peptide synthetase [Inhella inkyongensis]MBB5204057.1 amino acid adenylation domain-containing protein [Inhella inkyongensis]